MLVIALDTSTPAVTAGLVALDANTAEPRVLAERVTINPRAHGELLMPQVLEVLGEADRQLGEVDAVVVGCGPGPFTGLRVGMVTAAALGQTIAAPVYPVCSLDAIAAQVEGDGPLLVVTDARRSEVYWAAYAGHKPDGGRARLIDPSVDRPENLPSRLGGLDVGYAAGEMANKHAELLGFDVVDPRYPTPAGLVVAASADIISGAEPQPLVPLYLRRPDAATPGPAKPVTTSRDRT